VIAEDTLIEPWQSDFIVSTSKKVTVEVKSQSNKKTIRESSKPQVKIKNVKNHFNPINEMVKTLKENNMTLKKVLQNKTKIVSVLENYSNKVNYQGGSKTHHQVQLHLVIHRMIHINLQET